MAAFPGIAYGRWLRHGLSKSAKWPMLSKKSVLSSAVFLSPDHRFQHVTRARLADAIEVPRADAGSSLAVFREMFKGEPSQVLRAIGYFKDGDLPTLHKVDQELLRNARDEVEELPVIHIITEELAAKADMCEEGNAPR